MRFPNVYRPADQIRTLWPFAAHRRTRVWAHSVSKMTTGSLKLEAAKPKKKH